MHLAFLTPEYPHPRILNSAGIGTSIFNLAQELLKQKHQVTVFVYSQNEDTQFNDNGVNIVKIAYKKYRILGWYLYRKHIEGKINFFINKNNIDLLEAPDWTGITAFMKLNCPIVIRIHGSDNYFCHLEGRKQKWKNKWFEKIALKKANSIIAVSEFAGKLTSKLFNIRKDISTIPNALNLDEFYPINIKPKNKDIILYFGTIIRKKGVFELPNIFRLIKENNNNVELVLIGNDSPDLILNSNSTWHLLKQKFEPELLKSVKYHNKVSYSKLTDYINKSSICIFPSYAESFGMVTIEAMAMGKPVIVSDFGWSREIIEHGKDGFLIEHGNYLEFSKHALYLLNNKIYAESIGENARLKVMDCFDMKKIVEQNILYYTSIISIK
jgi:glycosyltransferase involved in cell wall biosynthesis